MGKKTKPVESQCSEWRRGALEAQHWFSSVYWMIMLLCSLKYSGEDWKCFHTLHCFQQCFLKNEKYFLTSVLTMHTFPLSFLSLALLSLFVLLLLQWD